MAIQIIKDKMIFKRSADRLMKTFANIYEDVIAVLLGTPTIPQYINTPKRIQIGFTLKG